MALMLCRCCRKEISVNAEKCPFCGEPINYTEEQKRQAVKENRNASIISFIITAIICIVIFVCIYNWLGNEFMKWAEALLEFVFDVNIEM